MGASALDGRGLGLLMADLVEQTIDRFIQIQLERAIAPPFTLEEAERILKGIREGVDERLGGIRDDIREAG